MKRSKPIHDKQAYLGLFSLAGDDQLTGEASTSYLWDPDSAQLIYAANPEAKIIAILRNPVERVFSHYQMYRQKHDEPRTLEAFVEDGLREGADNHDRHHIESGFYYRNLQRYVKLFGTEQVHVIAHSELHDDPQGMMNRLCEFLGIERIELPAFPANNPTYVVSDNLLGRLQKWRQQHIPLALPLPQKFKSRFRRRYLKPRMDRKIEVRLRSLYAEDSRQLKEWLGAMW